MKREWEDDELQRSFAELRAADEQATPPFDATLAAALAAARAALTPRAVPALGRRLAAAAAGLLIASGGTWLALRPHRPPVQSAAVSAAASLSRWRSPTAFLLEGPSDVLVRTLPSISTSSEELNALGVKDTRGGRS